jgi:HEAT repeat protein
VQALTGLGLLRNPEHLERVVRFLTHPEAMVRMSAAIALGRIGNPAAVEPLLTLLGSTEANENVRLAARKALQALAGDIDCGYDVAEWRKAFQRKKS